MPKTKSKMSLSERREAAFKLFSRGYTNVAVAEELKVSRDTVKAYREKYDASIHAQAQANPNYLRDVVARTFQSLDELDQIREDAWKHMQRRKEKREFDIECPDCGSEFVFVAKLDFEISDQTRAQYHNVLLKAQDQRSKLFGVMGVKQDVMIAVMQVKMVQDKLLQFMADHLCAADREELETFLQTPELQRYMATSSLEPAKGLLELPSEEVEYAEIVED